MDKNKFFVLIFGILFVFLWGCDKTPDLEIAQSRTKVAIRGSFVTENPDEVRFPVKVLFALDSSLSMGDDYGTGEGGSDPDNLRLEAARNFITMYNENENVSFEIMLWNQSVFDATYVTVDGSQQRGFTKDPAELNRVLDNSQTSTTTDYLGTLETVYFDIEQDIRNSVRAGYEDDLIRTKYVVVFLSDGMPVVGQSQVQDSSEIYQSVEGLRQMVEDNGCTFNFHTGLLPGLLVGYPDALIECQNLLWTMANRGNGQFTQFDTAENINFINIVDMRLTLQYTVQYIVAYNYNVKPGLEIVYLDSDGDGLTDEEEEATAVYINDLDENNDGLYCSPTNKDTDGDGMSDFFEAELSAPGAELHPNNPDDSPCQMILGFWPDSDEDGLTDCEEFVKGTNRYIADTDADSMPDGIEFLAGSKPLETQFVKDTDFDGVVDWLEVQHHTNLNSDDPKIRERYSYQYNLINRGNVIIDQGTSMESVVTRYDFSISNIDIMDTVAHTTADGDEINQGDNTIRVYIAEIPDGRDDVPPVFRMAEIVVNIHDGINEIILTPGDFTLIQ